MVTSRPPHTNQARADSSPAPGTPALAGVPESPAAPGTGQSHYASAHSSFRSPSPALARPALHAAPEAPPRPAPLRPNPPQHTPLPQGPLEPFAVLGRAPLQDASPAQQTFSTPTLRAGEGEGAGDQQAAPTAGPPRFHRRLQRQPRGAWISALPGPLRHALRLRQPAADRSCRPRVSGRPWPRPPQHPRGSSRLTRLRGSTGAHGMRRRVSTGHQTTFVVEGHRSG